MLFGENTASSRFISHSPTDLGQFYAWETKRVSQGSLCIEGFWRLAVVLLLYQHPGTQKRKSSASKGPDKPHSLRSGLKSKCEVLVAQVCPSLCEPTDCSPPGSSVHGVLQARILEWVPSLLRGIFLTQGWKPILHCRQILYRLSHQGSSTKQEMPNSWSWESLQVSSRGIPQKQVRAVTVLCRQGEGFSFAERGIWSNRHPFPWKDHPRQLFFSFF